MTKENEGPQEPKEERLKENNKKRFTKNFYSVIIIAVVLIITSIVIYSYRSDTTELTKVSDIEISFTPNPVLCEDGEWNWKVNISENGKAITDLKTFSRKIYRDNECLVTYVYDEIQIKKWLDSTTLTASSPLSFDAGFNCQEITHEIDLIEGISRSGVPVKLSGKVNFLF